MKLVRGALPPALQLVLDPGPQKIVSILIISVLQVTADYPGVINLVESEVVDVTVVPDEPSAATVTPGGTDASVASRECTAPEARYDLRVLQSLRQIIRAVDLHSRRLLAQHKITGPQLFALLAVEKHGPLTATAIARHIHLSPSTVIGIVDRLESRGLVERNRDQHDRRLIHISLTEQGRVLAGNAPSPLQDTLTDAMGQLPESELEIIAESLERIVELMEVRHVDAAPILETASLPNPTDEAPA